MQPSTVISSASFRLSAFVAGVTVSLVVLFSPSVRSRVWEVLVSLLPLAPGPPSPALSGDLQVAETSSSTNSNDRSGLKSSAGPYLRLPDEVEVLHLDSLNADIESSLVDKFLTELESSDPVIGLDAEWVANRDSRSTRLSLLQLATRHSCLLIRLNFRTKLPDKIVELLSDARILKVGVSIAQDVKLLMSQYNISIRGCVELQQVALHCGFAERGTGLKALAKTILDYKLNKSSHLRCSNWEATTLSVAQVEYAALDAWVGERLFARMFELSSDRTSPSVLVWAKKWLDQIRFRPPRQRGEGGNNQNSKKNGGSGEHWEPSEDHPWRTPHRRSALYDNCVMLAPDGQHLCSTNRKRVDWYLKRDLAVVEQEEPNFVIRLKMEPRGRTPADSFLLAEKLNRCVVCGNTEKYLRHSIVPHSFRRHFPEEAKHKDILKATLVEEFRSSEREELKTEREGNIQLRKAAAALLRDHDRVPHDRIEALKGAVAEHLGKDKWTDNELKELTKLPSPYMAVKSSSAHSIESRYMNTHVTSHEEIGEFVRLWRRHFVESMSPRFLPEGWSVDYPVFPAHYGPKKDDVDNLYEEDEAEKMEEKEEGEEKVDVVVDFDDASEAETLFDEGSF